MMPLFCAMKKEMRDRVMDGVREVNAADGLPYLDFAADYAHDGVYGGDYKPP